MALERTNVPEHKARNKTDLDGGITGTKLSENSEQKPLDSGGCLNFSYWDGNRATGGVHPRHRCRTEGTSQASFRISSLPAEEDTSEQNDPETIRKAEFKWVSK